MSAKDARFQEPGWFTKNVFNRIVAGLARLGISFAGSAVLEVKGRKSGEWRQTPVNPLPYEGARYLVAPRGDESCERQLASGPARSAVRVIVSAMHCCQCCHSCAGSRWRPWITTAAVAAKPDPACARGRDA